MRMKADATAVLSSYSKAVNNILFDEGSDVEGPAEKVEEKAEAAEDAEAVNEAAADAADEQDSGDFFG